MAVVDVLNDALPTKYMGSRIRRDKEKKVMELSQASYLQVCSIVLMLLAPALSLLLRP